MGHFSPWRVPQLMRVATCGYVGCHVALSQADSIQLCGVSGKVPDTK